ncbi:amidohydrolase family protein [Hyperthermus butylicus]|uniref:amidohydrolase family protein n=1 Tax=Hyperthermus butylicus TaxID=54248 RepID=UPI001E617133|nr:amidohydrolase family protein [Hyperthermus butylicus]
MRQSRSSRGFCICADYVVAGSELELLRAACIEFNEEGIVVGVGASRSPGRPCSAVPGYIMPPLCNGHIHVLDYALAEAREDKPLESLVAHPTGLKYKLLEALGEAKLEAALRTLAARLQDEGILYLGAYAEMGFSGAQLVSTVLQSSGLRVRLLPQPLRKTLPDYEYLLEAYGGAGLDTVFDLNPGELAELAAEARRRGLSLHVHVSETRQLREMRDYELALEAKPTATVHLTHLEPKEVLALAAAGVLPVFCPRSNSFHGVGKPPLEVLPQLAGEQVPVALGTDNAAWIPPSIAEELSHAYMMWRPMMRSKVEEYARSLLYAATLGCTSLLGLQAEPIEQGSTTVLVAALPDARYTNNPLITLIKRLSIAYKQVVSTPGWRR